MATITSPSLKSCPFCGGDAEMHEGWRKGSPNLKKYWVECSACGTAMKNHSCFKTVETAAKFWNERGREVDLSEAIWVAEHGGGFTPGGNPIYHCSKCGWIFGSHMIFPDYAFCPECGRRMANVGRVPK